MARKRTVLVAATLAAACLAAGVGIVSCVIHKAPKAGERQDQAPQAHDEKTTTPPENSVPSAPEYENLPVQYGVVHIDGPETRIGFYNEDTEQFFAWKGIMLQRHDVPGFFDPYRGTVLVPLASVSVKEISPPVYYMKLDDGKFGPGYFFAWSPYFFRWKGVSLSADQLPEGALPTRLVEDAPGDQLKRFRRPTT